MSCPGESDFPLKQHRSPRLPFDSLVRLAATGDSEKSPLWGRSTDLCRKGIGVTVVVGELMPDELITIEIPLRAATVSVEASVRYCRESHCGFEFVGAGEPQRGAIRAACERLRKGGQR